MPTSCRSLERWRAVCAAGGESALVVARVECDLTAEDKINADRARTSSRCGAVVILGMDLTPPAKDDTIDPLELTGAMIR